MTRMLWNYEFPLDSWFTNSNQKDGTLSAIIAISGLMTLPCHISFAFFMLEALPESLLDLLVPVIRFYCKSRRIGHDVSNLNATSIWLRSFADQCYVTDRSSNWRLESGQCVTVQQTAFFVKFVSTKSPHNKPYTRVLTRESSWFLKENTFQYCLYPIEKVSGLKEIRESEFHADFRAQHSEFRNGCVI
jgi:hypothetical protein